MTCKLPNVPQRAGQSASANPLLIALVAVLGLMVPLAWWMGKKSAGTGGDASNPQVEIREKVVEKIVEVPQPPEPLPRNLVSYRSRMDAAKLFNGINVKSELISEPGQYASIERTTDDSYQIDFQLRLRIPTPNSSIADLAKINAELPSILPGLNTMVPGGQVSGFYNYIYDLKQKQVQSNITRLESALSRHNFYDCETILELQHPETGRKALLLQGEMDVVSDGSDGDRMPVFDDYIASSQHFQPSTSYAWPKQTSQPNPLLARMKTQLAAAQERYKVSGLTRAENARLESQIKNLPITIQELSARSYLIAQEDPFIVIPLSTRKYAGFNDYTPLIGDYAAVIHGNRILPAIVGDYGPSTKTGEASLRIAKELDPQASPYRRPVSDLTVTYVIFPNSRIKPFKQPVLSEWHAQCQQLIDEIGGLGQGYTLHQWEDHFEHLHTTEASVPPAATDIDEESNREEFVDEAGEEPQPGEN
ncbi:MAG: glycoside hydrolase family 75 protein [Verrucomicrobiales bacterium]